MRGVALVLCILMADANAAAGFRVPRISPEEVGFSPARLDSIDRFYSNLSNWFRRSS